jgi:cell division protein FtsB
VSLLALRHRLAQLRERAAASGPWGLVWGACGLALLMVLFVLADPRGVRRLLALRAQVAQQQQANLRLQQANEALQAKVRALSHPIDPKLLEREAREQLGWVKQGELLIQFE